MKRPRYRRLRKAGAQWHGRKDCISVFIVRRIRRDGSISYRWYMDGLLFDPIEYIDSDIAADVLKDLT